jgi:thioredoxin-like negative regulator of GroEL
MSANKPNNPPAKAAADAKSAAGRAAAPAPVVQPGSTPGPAAAHVIPLFRRIDWLAFGVTTLLVMIGYWWTLAPDMTLQDSGELAVGSFYAGIPHPPGYPVWTIYTWLFTLLPISNIAFRVGLSSAVAAAFSCGMVAMMVSRGSSMLMEGLAELKNIERKWENWICVVSGFVSGMLLGFNGFMWSQAVIVEVYTLSVLSLAGVMLCVMRWIYAPHQRRYLYLAFFWFGICFNNHQSLLVIALGLEVAILVTQPRLGRDLIFWNWIIWLGGHIGRKLGMVGVLNDNPPLLLIYNLIGLASLGGWLALAFKTKKSWLELARDFVMLAVVGYVVVVLGTITSWVTMFYARDALVLKTGPFILFNLVGVGIVAGFIYLVVQTRNAGREWLGSLACGGAWLLGAAFYLYMPLAGMSNPPMQWGYPRTVQGFFHAFTRGQYEKIHPTFGGNFFDDMKKFFQQLWMYTDGAMEEFNPVYLLIALLPLLFYKRMQARERAWGVATGAIYLCLSIFLLVLLNPAPDRQSRDLNKVFFTASHVMIAMGVGYGLTLAAALLHVSYERFRLTALVAGGVAAMIALYGVAYVQWTSLNPIEHATAYVALALALAALALLALNRTRAPLKALLALFALLPVWSIMSHWEKNEQRGHLFGYWFGHDMFTPPFTGPDGKLTYDNKLRAELLKKPEGRLIYPEMDRDTVLYGGTDPGRFNPTYMIFCESFLPPGKKPNDPHFDRRDVYLITQNALADGTYLMYIRAHYNRSDQVQYDTPFFQELFRGPRELATGTRTNFLARLMIPVDRFFIGLGDRIEKKRRAGSSFFQEGDFTDLPAFVGKLRAAQDPLSQHIVASLSKETAALLAPGGDSPALRRALAKDLNRLIDRELANQERWHKLLDQKAALDNAPATTNAADRATLEQKAAERQRVEKELAELTLYHEGRFEGVKLSETTKRFIAQNPRLHARVRLNRLLLEEAYPGLIARSPGGVYPDREILTATPEDSQRAFSEYLADAQRRLEHDRKFPNEPKQIKPGEDVRIIENRVQVSGQVAVMSINAILTKIMFDKNPGHEFYVEESFPLDWMYPYLTPFGIIMKINRNPLPELSQDIVDRDHHFWSQYSDRLIGDWVTYDTSVSNICHFAEQVYIRRKYRGVVVDGKETKPNPTFVRDDDAQKAFSKLRSSIGGVYNWRFTDASNKLRALQMKPPAEQQALLPEIQRLAAEQQRMLKEADFTFKQAYAFCPYSPEAVFRYITLLVNVGRLDDALLLARTSIKLDPYNGQIIGLISELERIKRAQAGAAPPPVPIAPATAEIAGLEQQFAAHPSNFPVAYRLIEAYIIGQQNTKALEVLDKLLDHPQAGQDTFLYAAQTANRLGQMPRVEKALARLVKVAPENPEAWFDLAGIQALLNNPTGAIAALRESLQRSAQRLAREPTALNLYSNALTDPRFNAVRPRPEFQQLMAELKPK